MAQSPPTLTAGPLGRQIVRFSLPLVFSNVLQVLFNMSDVAVVGRFGDAAALGSVGSTSTLCFLFTGWLLGMGGGVNVLIAWYYGARDEKQVADAIPTALMTCGVFGLLIGLLGQLSTVPMLNLLGTKPELLAGAVLYLRIYFCGMPAVALYNFGSGVLSAIGETKLPLRYLSISGVVNVLLNLFFVIVLHRSVDGVAAASILAQYLSAFLVLRALARRTDCCRLTLRHFRFDAAKCRRLLTLGIPAGFQNAIFAFANLFLQGGVNTFATTMVEGNAAATNAESIIYNVMAAFYTACSSFIGQNYSAGKRSRVKQSYLLSLLFSFLFGLALGLLFFLFGHSFLSLFTAEEAVIADGLIRLRLMSICCAFSAFMDCTISASRGLGKTLVPTVIVIFGDGIFRIIWIYTVFAYFRTPISLYLLFIASWTITAVAEIIYFIRCYRKQLPSPAL